ncbi:MAG: glycine/betaine ABC transporter substrate-binding protein [Deltaproteobacteria bacterium]|nr:MAG: glycine/betaine ABC transporter substrate-binding protein [Deltaproteobacteria bacterium]
MVRKILIVLLATALSLSLMACSRDDGDKKPAGKITIGSKNFTEQIILGEMLALFIEDQTEIKVERKLNLGGTMICFGALKQGDLDLYPEYTGTGLTAILKQKAITDPDTVLKTVKSEFKKQYDLVWLEPFGFNNTYTLTMRGDHARELGVSQISDLQKYRDNLKSGFTAEFMERPDGYPGLIKHYGFEFAVRPKDFDPGLMYKAVSEGSVDVICAFATDGRIPAYGLKVLEDDKRFFPPYHAAPLIRAATLKKYPQLTKVLNILADRIDNDKMATMNYRVDKQGVGHRQVAEEFLRSNGLIK